MVAQNTVSFNGQVGTNGADRTINGNTNENIDDNERKDDGNVTAHEGFRSPGASGSPGDEPGSVLDL